MRFLPILAMLATSVCAPRASLHIPGIPDDVDPSIALLVNSHTAGHACPVAGYGVFSASHVVLDDEGKARNMMWSQGNNYGRARPLRFNNYTDLVMLELNDATYFSLPLGHALVGETVFWFEYDFRTRPNILRARRRHATILRVVAGHIMLDEAPEGGASGTCLISNQGGVIGIINSGWPSHDGKFEGMAIMLSPHLEGV